MPGKQRGRPRSPRVHEAILRAAAELVVTGGYERLTMEAIAARAGVGKQTVYRRWPSRSAVVAEAALSGHLVPAGHAPDDTGDVVADLRDWLRAATSWLGQPGGGAVVRALAAAASDRTSDAARLYEQFTGPFHDALVARLARGVEEGRVRADAALGPVADALVGVLLYRALAQAAPLTTADADALVAVLFTGLDTSG
ncbi:TetR/AcrR family transcriptional regulator [Blastococcus sp. TF02A-26]|uniref:TetR/AcrR family transcriptional regulator n=1 Tax=Blastococcus sp. TF02A-26 TaxID=2250577 RepID=UPI000DEB146B|nr:TetR/AcrR family transcriptional regulator [Blastococcus sp. TF02A-26]RBY85124.1 TetR family transcriptional regulator [Blastococcus sp. TF02A-26]